MSQRAEIEMELKQCVFTLRCSLLKLSVLFKALNPREGKGN